ncbi:TonB C-terminal domain-containing protein [Sulfurospirillum arcachonense]|uniref:TonB C-terminal domain-containing protein n=1 Tax=Sulfurospirillum arcachonense TaxID=57666 RepID=UPI00046954E3|nr:TonB C-terminal domain-containing protein [Sulfurospirillum arcachonense]
MPSTSNSSIVGWTLSFILYFIFLSIGIYVLQSHNIKNQKYTASKKNLLNVTLVDRKNKKTIKKKKQKVVKKKNTVDKPKPVEKKKTIRSTKKASIPKTDLSKLFGKIDVDKIPEETQKRKKEIRKKIVKKEIEEVEKVDKAKNITKHLEFDQQENLVITQKDGIYDEFRGKISDILDSNWQQTINTVSGNKADVIISIDKLGNFSYKIETLSYNDAFNAKLRNFLEEMRDVRFPPFTKGEIFNMKVVFKDILE